MRVVIFFLQTVIYVHRTDLLFSFIALPHLATQIRWNMSVCPGELQLRALDDICDMPIPNCLQGNDFCEASKLGIATDQQKQCNSNHPKQQQQQSRAKKPPSSRENVTRYLRVQTFTVEAFCVPLCLRTRPATS